ncbi:hypothetical protein A5736_20385 [Mycobacterium sp. SP-6446]|nr:hypothetical protein A5736_20385 [Mycobacterium sp. SP-6446]
MQEDTGSGYVAVHPVGGFKGLDSLVQRAAELLVEIRISMGWNGLCHNVLPYPHCEIESLDQQAGLLSWLDPSRPGDVGTSGAYKVLIVLCDFLFEQQIWDHRDRYLGYDFLGHRLRRTTVRDHSVDRTSKLKGLARDVPTSMISSWCPPDGEATPLPEFGAGQQLLFAGAGAE